MTISASGIHSSIERLRTRVRKFHKFLKAWSYGPYPKHLEEDGLEIGKAEVQVIQNLVSDYAVERTGNPPSPSVWKPVQEFYRENCTFHSEDYAATEAEYFRWFLIWLEATDTYVTALDGAASTDNSTQPIHFTYIEVANMGDHFENIKNATIVNRSTVESSFNALKDTKDRESAEALLRVAEKVEASKNPAAGMIFDHFSQGVSKPDPDKTTMKGYWDSLVKLVPDIASMGASVAKIVSLFS